MAFYEKPGISSFTPVVLLSLFVSFSGCLPDVSPVDPDRAYETVSHLVNYIGPRSIDIRWSNEAAAAYIHDRFIEYGVQDVGFQNFKIEWRSDLGGLKNVVGEIKGTTHPESYIVISAHFDTAYYARGATDNATGVAGLLELARIFASEPPAYTFKLAGFNAEEYNFDGSWDYRNRQIISGELDRTVMILNLDMLQSNSSSKTSPLILFVLSPNRHVWQSLADARKECGIMAQGFVPVTPATAVKVTYELNGDVIRWKYDDLILSWPWAYDESYHGFTDTLDMVDRNALAANIKVIYVFLKKIMALPPEMLKPDASYVPDESEARIRFKIK